METRLTDFELLSTIDLPTANSISFTDLHFISTISSAEDLPDKAKAIVSKRIIVSTCHDFGFSSIFILSSPVFVL
jgi:hypothetical protein